MIIQGERIALYGWESVPTIDKDTIYYRAETKLGDTIRLTSSDFQFYKTRLTSDNVDKFQPDKDISVPNFLLHRYIYVTKYDKEVVEVRIMKDVYDSRSDEFVFVRVK